MLRITNPTRRVAHALLLWLALVSSAVAAQPQQLADTDIPDVTILSTMIASFVGEGEWGFAALLEFPDEAILFDTGFKSHTVKDNAALLGKDLSGVEKVVLTHFHSDHTGGLLTLRRAFMESQPAAFSQVYVARGFFEQRYSQDGMPMYSLPNPGFTETFTSPEQFRKAAQDLGIAFTVLEEPLEIRPGVVLSGPIPRPHQEKNVGAGFFLKNINGKLEADTIPESQVVGLNTADGWVLISGCGHAGIINASTYLRQVVSQPVKMAVGGFHLFQADETTIAWTGNKLKEFGVQSFVGAHCTGAHATRRLADILELERSAVSMGAIGTRIDGKLGITPSSIE